MLRTAGIQCVCRDMPQVTVAPDLRTYRKYQSRTDRFCHLVLWAQSTTKDYVMAALTENTVDRQTQTNRDQEDERNRESSCRRKLDTTNAYFLASQQSLPVDWLLQLRMFHHLIQVTSGTNVPSDILIDLAVHKPSTNALFTRHYKILSSGMVVVKKTGKWKK